MSISVIDYKIRRSKRARNLRIEINCEAEVIVVAPRLISLSRIEMMIKEKAGWILSALSKVKKRIPLEKPAEMLQGSYHACSGRAKQLIKSRLEYYNQFYNFTFNQLSIKRQKTRWGSCSKRGQLNFNYKLLFLSQELVDYVVVHELCHLQEMNHSRNFWSLVAKTIPDHKERRRQLKKFTL